MIDSFISTCLSVNCILFAIVIFIINIGLILMRLHSQTKCTRVMLLFSVFFVAKRVPGSWGYC
jgi:uncharacterized membrane protein YhaH (DUF805 family)